jgi:hypothetical protein
MHLAKTMVYIDFKATLETNNKYKEKYFLYFFFLYIYF